MGKLIGYVGSRDLGQILEADVQSLNGINIAFGVVREGRVYWEAERYLADLARIRQINPQIKILLSVGGWGAGGFSDAAATEGGRRLFAQSARELVQKAGLDGIDIDWEYPTVAAAGIEARPEDRENFTLLLEAIRQELDGLQTREHLLLTIAAGAGDYFIQGTEIKKLGQLLDYIQIMTYDQADAHVRFTGHHTNLCDYAKSKSSAKSYIRLFVNAGVPKEKIVLGAAFYSRKWDGVGSARHGYRQEAETIGEFGPDYGLLHDEYINKNGYIRYWDEEARAPYLFNGSSYISYDDEESIGHKIDYLKAEGLYGIMYWEYKCDTTRTLTRMMAKRLEETL